MANYNSQTELTIAQNLTSPRLVSTKITSSTQKILYSPIWAFSSLGLLIVIISLIIHAKWSHKKLFDMKR